MLSKPGDRILSQEEQDRFLNDLALTHAGWQVEQANDALRLYEYLVVSRTQLCVSCILFRTDYSGGFNRYAVAGRQRDSAGYVDRRTRF